MHLILEVELTFHRWNKSDSSPDLRVFPEEAPSLREIRSRNHRDWTHRILLVSASYRFHSTSRSRDTTSTAYTRCRRSGESLGPTYGRCAWRWCLPIWSWSLQRREHLESWLWTSRCVCLMYGSSNSFHRRRQSMDPDLDSLLGCCKPLRSRQRELRTAAVTQRKSLSLS